MDFPDRIYTLDEFRRAKEAIAKGHRHQLAIVGDDTFQDRLARILELIDLAGYGDLLRTYIREIRQISGLGQLRETEASIWLNGQIAEDPIEGARFVIQKTLQMNAYIEGQSWYILGELPAVRGSVEFLKKLKDRLTDPELRRRCEGAINEWTADQAT